MKCGAYSHVNWAYTFLLFVCLFYFMKTTITYKWLSFLRAYSRDNQQEGGLSMQHFTCGVLSDVVNDVSISTSSRSSNELHGQKFIANTDGLKTYNFSLFSIALNCDGKKCLLSSFSASSPELLGQFQPTLAQVRGFEFIQIKVHEFNFGVFFPNRRPCVFQWEIIGKIQLLVLSRTTCKQTWHKAFLGEGD